MHSIAVLVVCGRSHPVKKSSMAPALNQVIALTIYGLGCTELVAVAIIVLITTCKDTKRTNLADNIVQCISANVEKYQFINR